MKLDAINALLEKENSAEALLESFNAELSTKDTVIQDKDKRIRELENNLTLMTFNRPVENKKSKSNFLEELINE